MLASVTTSMDTHTSSTTTEDSGSQLVCGEETVRLRPVTAASDASSIPFRRKERDREIQTFLEASTLHNMPVSEGLSTLTVN